MKKNILRSLFNKFGIFRILSKSNSPRIAAITFFLTSSIIKSKKIDAPTMIYIHKGIGIDDIEAMAKFSNQINYIVLQSSFLREIFRRFFGLEIYENKNIHTDYHLDSNLFPIEKKKEYKKFLSETFNFFEKLANYDGFISSNYVYSYLQELSSFAVNKRKTYVVLYKEALVSKKYVSSFIKRYTNHKFTGTALLTYNEYIKEAFIQSNIDGFNKDNVVSVGMPRLDFYQDLKIRNNHIVFFSFYPDDKFAYLEDKHFFNTDLKNKINSISENFHINVIKYANQNLEKKLIIKTKFPKKYMNYVYNIVQENNLTLSYNISITNDQNTTILIKNASAVLGYNSTTLTEALTLGKKTIIPDFSSIIPQNDNIDYFIDYENVVKKVLSYNELHLSLSSNSQSNKEETNQFLKDYISNDNFQASKKAESEIIRYIVS
tara:strand:+ start:25808 stop:27106 length:1299 start_codon:yes stop_codon:yes gene_type:complete